MKPDEIAALFNSDQGSRFLEWLDKRTDVKYPATQDGIKASMDMAMLVGRKSLVDEIKQHIEKGQNNG